MLTQKQWMQALVVSLLGMMVWGCARNQTHLSVGYGGNDLAPPNTILVYDFDVTAGEVGLDQSPVKKLSRVKQENAETEAAIGSAVAGALAERIVRELRDLGLPAQRFRYDQHMPEVGQVVKIQGEFLKIDEGKRLRRLVIGFGLGSAEVMTQTHVFVAHQSSSQLVQQFQSTSKSGIRPGVGVMTGVGAVAGTAGQTAVVSSATNLAGEKISGEVAKLATNMAKNIVKNLRPFMQSQGWIGE